jgi:3-methyladenine DNA glycosylase AlkD
LLYDGGMSTKQAKTNFTRRQVMTQLKAWGNEQYVAIARNHGILGEMFGVSYENLKKLDKQVADDQKLAEELWATGVVDARIFACWTADEHKVTAKCLDAWAREVEDPGVALEVAALAAYTKLGPKQSRKWRVLKDAWRCSMGWRIVGSLAMQPDRDESEGGISDAELAECLVVIEARIHDEKNKVRQTMNQALISIGCRSTMTKQALAVAKRVGPVFVDQGKTGCKTDVAYDKIKKVIAHYKARGKQPTDGAAGKRRRHC